MLRCLKKNGQAQKLLPFPCRGGGLYKRTHLYSFDWDSSTHWLPYYCREITSNMHMASLAGKTPSRDQECQVGRWQIWHGRKLCLGSYCANLHYFIPDQLKLWKINDVLFLGHISLFAEWYSLFFSWFFHYFCFFKKKNKACSSGLELSMGSHQHSCFLFQSWWFLRKKIHLLMETGAVSILWTFLFPLHKWRQMLWWKYFSYSG